MKTQKEIACCPKCGEPVQGTYMISGAEWFCVSCKHSGGMFYEDRKEHTPELKKRQKLLRAKFDKLCKDYIPPTAFYGKCKLCDERNEHHILHASDKDKEKSKIAHDKLLG